MDPAINDSAGDADGDGTFNITEYQNGSQPNDSTAPNALTNFTGAPGNAQVALGWNASGAHDFLQYDLYRELSPITDVGLLTPITTISTVGTTTFTDMGVSNGTTYFYAITVVDDSQNTSSLEALGPYTPDGTAPNPVTTSLAVNAGGNGILVSWTVSASSDFSHYNIYREEASFTDLESVLDVREERVAFGENAAHRDHDLLIAFDGGQRRLVGLGDGLKAGS